MPRPHVTRRSALLAALALGLPVRGPRAAAFPIPSEVATELPAARLQGAGRLRVVGLLIYEARLWVGERAVTEDWNVPMALEIEYRRALDGGRIAERSLDEMRRQGEIAPAAADRWLRQMRSIFPDVREGDRLTGVKLPLQAARFFHNGALRGEVRDAEFARRFFGIWLSPQTSDPSLRLALLAGRRT